MLSQTWKIVIISTSAVAAVGTSVGTFFLGRRVGRRQALSGNYYLDAKGDVHKRVADATTAKCDTQQARA